MAKAIKGSLFWGLSGSVGEMVFRRMPDGSTRVSKKPDFSERVCSPAQLQAQARFKRAVAYAREAAKTQPVYAALAREKNTIAYNLALSDWFKAPVVHRIERKHGRVCVEASDNVMVTEVHVRILDGDGNTLAQGHAQRIAPCPNAGLWEFPAVNMDGTIEATACDLAGNRSVAVLEVKASC